MSQEVLAQIARAVWEGDAEGARRLCQEALDAGLTVSEITSGGLIAGMMAVAERFKNRQIFVPEVLVAARAIQFGLDVLAPHVTGEQLEPRGRVVLGTVAGDLHDIGKNLVGMMMRGAGLEVVDRGVTQVQWPRLVPIRQKFVSRPLDDIPAAVSGGFRRAGVLERVRPGDKVAVACGSRGIANLSTIVRAVVEEFKSLRANPFVVPAMGSHGSATAEGQVQILAHYGITPDAIGCPIVSSMEAVEVGRSPEGIIAYVDREALSADHIVVVNRVKPHTEFEGRIESGLIKMICIGLGKHRGALHYHQAGVTFGMEHALRTGARVVISNCPVLCGVAIVEDGYGQTAVVEVIPAARIEAREEELLLLAKEWAPRLPFPRADVLIVEQMGKDISGAGMDTKVIGRVMSPYSPEPQWPRITRVVVLDVTPGSEGNCVGVGLADFTTRRLVEKVDRVPTYINAVAAQSPEKARIPPYYDTDEELLRECFATIGLVEPPRARVMRIKNTLHLEQLWISEAYLEEAKCREDLEILGDAVPMQFDARGRLVCS